MIDARLGAGMCVCSEECMGFEVSAVCLEMDVLLPQTIGHLDEHLEKSNCSCCWCCCHWPKQIGRREVA